MSGRRWKPRQSKRYHQQQEEVAERRAAAWREIALPAALRTQEFDRAEKEKLVAWVRGRISYWEQKLQTARARKTKDSNDS